MGYCLRDENSGLRFGPPGRQRVLDGTFVQLNKLAKSLDMTRIQAVTGELECRWYEFGLELVAYGQALPDQRRSKEVSVPPT